MIATTDIRANYPEKKRPARCSSTGRSKTTTLRGVVMTQVTNRPSKSASIPNPAWSTTQIPTEIVICDEGTRDQWVGFEAVLATCAPTIHPTDKVLNTDLQIVALQYSGVEGDIPANTAVIELRPNPVDGGPAMFGPIVFVDYVPVLIDALTEALAKLGHTREANIRRAGKFVIDNAGVEK